MVSRFYDFLYAKLKYQDREQPPWCREFKSRQPHFFFFWFLNRNLNTFESVYLYLCGPVAQSGRALDFSTFLVGRGVALKVLFQTIATKSPRVQIPPGSLFLFFRAYPVRHIN